MDTWTNMCVGMYRDTRADMCLDMCADLPGQRVGVCEVVCRIRYALGIAAGRVVRAVDSIEGVVLFEGLPLLGQVPSRSCSAVCGDRRLPALPHRRRSLDGLSSEVCSCSNVPRRVTVDLKASARAHAGARARARADSTRSSECSASSAVASCQTVQSTSVDKTGHEIPGGRCYRPHCVNRPSASCTTEAWQCTLTCTRLQSAA